MNFRLGVVIQILTALCTHISGILGDNTGLLMSTLFTFQDHVCDKDRMHIRCPHETTINIQWAQYGRQVPSHELCSPFGLMHKPSVYGPTAGTGPSHNVVEIQEDLNCLSTTALRIVLDKCQDKRQCVIFASPQTFGQDPCPETSKYLEVAYNCRPNMFMSRVSCDGEQMQIKCDSSKRIAIYSAMFGRDAQNGLECPAEPEHDTECDSPCSVGVVMSLCHRKKRCTIPVSETTFGNACPAGTPKYLSVVYTCVSKRILKEMKEKDKYPDSFCGAESTESTETDNGGQNNGGPSPPGTDDDGDVDSEGDEMEEGEENPNGDGDQPDNLPGYRVSPSVLNYGTPAESTTPHIDGMEEVDDELESSSETSSADPDVSAVEEDSSGFLSEWFYTWRFLEDNKEKLILYLILGLFVGLVLLLLVIIMKLVMSRRNTKKKAALDISEPVASSSPGTRPEDMTLLDHSSQSDGIEMLSYNRSATLSRPSPFQSHSAGTNNRTAKNYYG